MDDATRPWPEGYGGENKVLNFIIEFLILKHKNEKVYISHVPYDRLDTILDGKFKPNAFNASWFQGRFLFLNAMSDFLSMSLSLVFHVLLTLF